MVTKSTGPGSAFKACSLENPGGIHENSQNRGPEEAFSGQSIVYPSKTRHFVTLDCAKQRVISELLRAARELIRNKPPLAAVQIGQRREAGYLQSEAFLLARATREAPLRNGRRRIGRGEHVSHMGRPVAFGQRKEEGTVP